MNMITQGTYDSAIAYAIAANSLTRTDSDVYDRLYDVTAPGSAYKAVASIDKPQGRTYYGEY